MNCFAVCALGLEPFTESELAHWHLGPKRPRPAAQGNQPEREEAGGVEFEGGWREIYLANLQLRSANRVLVRLGEFSAAGFPELRRKAHNLPWEQFLAAGQPVAVRVTSHASKLYIKRAIGEHIQQAIGDRLGKLPPGVALDEEAESAQPQLIVVRLVHDLCTLSVDSSGALLHRRGYRLAGAKAPLRETLAAGILLASGWDTGTMLLDPFCGSGTIPIEAALWASGRAPGLQRRFAFMDWPTFDERTWRALLAQARAAVHPPLKPILASDRDAGAIEMAQANAERAGVAPYIEFSRRAVSAITPPDETGWVVTNPPYGVRISEGKDLRNLYAQLGHVLRARCPGWRVALLSSDDRLLSCTGLAFEKGVSLVNGGLPVKLARGRVEPAGI